MEHREHVPRKTTVIQTVFTIEFDHEPLLQIVRCLTHDLGIAVLEDVVPANFDLAVTRLCTKRRLATEVDELPPEVALVLRNIGVKRGWQTRQQCVHV